MDRVRRPSRSASTAKRPKDKLVTILTAVALLLVVAITLGLYHDKIRVWYLLKDDFQSVGTNGQGYREYRHLKTGTVMVFVPGGTFLMGSPGDEEDALQSERPRHKVTLDPFLIAKHEVSQKVWRDVMRTNPSSFKGDDRPVDTLSFEDCQQFCSKTGLTIPTEAQWEYACRGGSTMRFGGTGRIGELGWCRENSNMKTHPSGKLKPNDFGLYDMHGNVLEWCLDYYDEQFYSKPAVLVPDPVCTSGPGEGVMRGGGWRSLAKYCRSAWRGKAERDSHYADSGFRPVFELP